MSQQAQSNKLSLGIIFLTVFIDLIGVGIALPVTAPLLLNNSTGLFDVSVSEEVRTLILGMLIASFPIATFFGSPILGALSDKYGRKKMLLISLIGTMIGYVIFAIGIYQKSIFLLVMSRMLDGFTGGNISIIQSAIADVSDAESKAKNFGLVGMAFGLGFIFGPFIGGILSDNKVVSWFSFDTPFLFAAALSLLNILMVIFRFKETLPQKIDREINFFSGFKNLRNAFLEKDKQLLFGGIFFFAFGFNFYTQFFQVYLIKKFGYTQSQIGTYFAYVGMCVALVQGTIVRRMSKKYLPGNIIKYSALGLAFALWLMLLPQYSWQLYLIVPFIAICQGLSSPNITSLVSQSVSPQEQGSILGINQSVLSAAFAVPPMVAAMMDLIDIRLPIIMSGIFVFIGWIFFSAYVRKGVSLFNQV